MIFIANHLSYFPVDTKQRQNIKTTSSQQQCKVTNKALLTVVKKAGYLYVEILPSSPTHPLHAPPDTPQHYLRLETRNLLKSRETNVNLHKQKYDDKWDGWKIATTTSRCQPSQAEIHVRQNSEATLDRDNRPLRTCFKTITKKKLTQQLIQARSVCPEWWPLSGVKPTARLFTK